MIYAGTRVKKFYLSPTRHEYEIITLAYPPAKDYLLSFIESLWDNASKIDALGENQIDGITKMYLTDNKIALFLEFKKSLASSLRRIPFATAIFAAKHLVIHVEYQLEAANFILEGLAQCRTDIARGLEVITGLSDENLVGITFLMNTKDLQDPDYAREHVTELIEMKIEQTERERSPPGIIRVDDDIHDRWASWEEIIKDAKEEGRNKLVDIVSQGFWDETRRAGPLKWLAGGPGWIVAEEFKTALMNVSEYTPVGRAISAVECFIFYWKDELEQRGMLHTLWQYGQNH